MRMRALGSGWAVTVVLAFTLAFAAAGQQAAPQGGAAQGGGGYTVQVVSPLVKLRPEEAVPHGQPREVRLWAARGEAESAQLIIAPAATGAGLKEVSVRAEALTGPGGSTIAPAVYVVGYVPVVSPTPGGFGQPGDYPDPLLPLRPFDVAPGRGQGVWLTVRVPREAPPGAYAGAIVIQPRGAEAARVAVSLTVANVVLPARSALHTWAPSWGQGASALAYGAAWNADRARAFELQLLEYRLTSPPHVPWETVFTQGADGQWQADWSAFDPAVAARLDEGANSFRIEEIFPWYGKPVDLTAPEDMAASADRAAKLALVDAHLAEKAWCQYFQFYIFDEPTISADYPNPGDKIGPENVAKIQAMARFIHAHAPHLRLMFVTCDPAYEAVALDFPAYVWVEHINHYHPDFQAKRRALGEPGWLYVCLTTKYVPAYPDIWRIDRGGASHRAIGWWAFRYHCDGFLYWCIDYWDKQDVFKNPDLYGGTSGDGFLFYPNPDKQGAVLPSVRVEVTRDGIEDFDLLTMLGAAVATARANATAATPALDEARRLLEVGDIIQAPDAFAQDPGVYEARHREILAALEQMNAQAP